MTKVRLLDDELINKIAAGEVVERPASVVKELVENAIDAGARQIKVSLREGGRSLIQVQDDGAGMEAADALLAVKRHTTSKLSRADDLFSVQTMGFRGEALASISSVSRFTLQTQAQGSPMGVRLVLEEGKLQSLPWQGAYGTTIAVSELFYNVAVRKAFMKAAAAEFAACHEYMLALALSLPQVGFTLVHNDREVFSVSPLPMPQGWPRGVLALRQRTEALFGKDFAAGLVYVQKQDRYARIEGLISAPGQDKGSAKHIFTFVNQRWVRDKLLRSGIMRGYHSHLLKGKFPIAILHIDMEAALVDVNVHPAKAELRFQYGSEVQNLIAQALREGLRSSSWAEAPSSQDAASAAAIELLSSAQNENAPDADKPTSLPEDFDLLLGARSGAPTDSLPGDTQTPPRESPLIAPAPGSGSPRSGASRADVSPGEARYPSPAPRDAIKRTTMSFDRMPARAPDRENGAPAPAPHPVSRSLAASPRRLTEHDFPPPGASAPRARELDLGPSPSSLGGGESGSRGDGKAFEAAIAPKTVPFSAPQRAPALAELHASQVAAREAKARASVDGQVIPWDELRYIGAFARCFLLFEFQDQLLAIDQHAFHERVLYERLSRDPDLLARTQPLLMPEVMAFSPTEIEQLREKKEQFGQWGIRYDVISEAEIEVKSVPSLLTNKDLAALVHGLIAGSQGTRELAHDVLATLACHAAVRAGEDLPPAELQALLREARTVDFYHNCPHGRRVFRWWKQSQVAAWFDRLS